MKFDSDIVAEAISDNIYRVALKRCRLHREAKERGDLDAHWPMLHMMDRAIHFAREARDERCPLAMLSWLRTLMDFKD